MAKKEKDQLTNNGTQIKTHQRITFDLPVKRLAIDLDVPNCVSKYFGRKTTNPLTMAISQQIPRLVNT